MAKTVSKRVQKAAEQYLASLGSSRDRLMPAQWQIVAKHVRNRRTFKWLLPIAISLAVLYFGLAYLVYDSACDYLALSPYFPPVNTRCDPNQIGDETELVHIYTKSCLMYGVLICFHSLMGFAWLVLPCVRWLSDRRMDRILKAFIPCNQEPPVTSLDKSASPH